MNERNRALRRLAVPAVVALAVVAALLLPSSPATATSPSSVAHSSSATRPLASSASDRGSGYEVSVRPVVDRVSRLVRTGPDGGVGPLALPALVLMCLGLAAQTARRSFRPSSRWSAPSRAPPRPVLR